MDVSFHEIISALERGDDSAAAEVFYRFADRLARLARTRLAERFRPRIDSDDVVQSVFRTFFRRKREGEFNLNDWDGLWSLLVVITLRKCGKQVESLQAACRDIRREAAPTTRQDGSQKEFQYRTREPSPEEIVGVAETLESLMSGLTPKEQETVSLRLQGYTVDEVGEQVSRTKRTVLRTLEKARARLIQLV